MTTDLDTLLRPFEGDSPCGPDMSFSVEFDALRELRREDDPTLDQGAWVTELKRADWPGLLSACESLLSTRTKDLRLAGWYAEASSRVRGYAGLADGLTLYTGLVRDAWNDVHPLPDGTDQELRIGSINWLLTLVGQACRRVNVLRHEDSAYSLADIDSARQRALAPAGSETAAGHPNMDDVQRVQRKTPLPQVMAVLADARRVPEALAALQTVVDANLGDDGPGFVSARETVADAVTALERIARDMGGVSGPTPVDAGGGDAASPTEAVSGGLLATRAQALAQLRLVAEFFRRTEPHSPVAYLVERAASWGEMPLHTWLRSVMKEQATLAQLEELLGVSPPPAND